MSIKGYRSSWRRSSHSAQGANCVEVAQATEAWAVRDSKDATGPVLTLTRDEWTALLDTIKTGTHDLP
ncbi:DUF397 domain-containing protein [Actinomadura sp. 7K507]|uniref:DUF397 domain-containing protein n=1 Tax=Actinomadura sp. 7K507 TaxID=2530365 RepID=UPI00104512E7|nr:DUF397 domain-containing protein [Actinomadura sp. 7K507]TDC91403.1 DUF397 domain-containing protein [Actinomadura sp. 7K507]